MNRLLRALLVLLGGSVVALAAVAMLSQPVGAARPAAPALTATPSNTPTGTPTDTPTATPTLTPGTPAATPEFWASLSITAGQTVVEVGQTLALTVDLEVSEGCRFGVMNLTVREEDTPGEPYFAHIDPADDTILPGGFPSRWTFRALQPGSARFNAYAFGEGDCDMGFFWHSEGAWSERVLVLPAGERPYRVWLPTVSRLMP